MFLRRKIILCQIFTQDQAIYDILNAFSHKTYTHGISKPQKSYHSLAMCYSDTVMFHVQNFSSKCLESERVEGGDFEIDKYERYDNSFQILLLAHEHGCGWHICKNITEDERYTRCN